MKIVLVAARYLLGVLFTVMGLNGFLHFIAMAPVPPLAGQFIGALAQTPYLSVVFVVELAGGVLLLTSLLPLGLVLLAPVIVNIDLFHAFMAPEGLPAALVVTFLWMTLAYLVRDAFLPLLKPAATHGIATGRAVVKATGVPALRSE